MLLILFPVRTSVSRLGMLASKFSISWMGGEGIGSVRFIFFVVVGVFPSASRDRSGRVGTNGTASVGWSQLGVP